MSSSFSMNFMAILAGAIIIIAVALVFIFWRPGK